MSGALGTSAAAYRALAKRLRLTDTCAISGPNGERKGTACERSHTGLTIALTTCPDGRHVLSITHIASGLALGHLLYRRGVVYQRQPHYEIPATPVGVKAARAMLRALTDLLVDWSTPQESLVTIPHFGARTHEAAWPHFAPLADAQDRAAMREYREELNREHPAGRGTAQWITNRVHERFWWQGGHMWAVSDRERAERDEKLNERDERLDGKAKP